MTKPMLMILMPMCMALIVASVLTLAYLTRDSLVAATDQQIQVWKYQFRVQVAVELGKVEADSVLIVADTLVDGVSR
jgi:hypothetical protein